MIAIVSNSRDAFLTQKKHNPGDYLPLSRKPTKDNPRFLNFLQTIQRVISKTTFPYKINGKMQLTWFNEN